VCGYSFTAEDVTANHTASTQAANTQEATATQVAATPASSSNEVTPASTSSINEVAPQEAQAIEVVAQPETVASTQPAAPVAPVAPAQSTQDTMLPEDDISLAPTQILSPQEMVAFQARRWQQDTGNTTGTEVSHSAESDSLPIGIDSSRPHAN